LPGWLSDLHGNALQQPNGSGSRGSHVLALLAGRRNDARRSKGYDSGGHRNAAVGARYFPQHYQIVIRTQSRPADALPSHTWTRKTVGDYTSATGRALRCSTSSHTLTPFVESGNGHIHVPVNANFLNPSNN
jgi:hypothetical protein